MVGLGFGLGPLGLQGNGDSMRDGSKKPGKSLNWAIS